MMNDEVIDPRTIAERCLMNSAESRALKGLADEYGLSKSLLLRLAFLKFLREHHDGSCLLSELSRNSTDLG